MCPIDVKLVIGSRTTTKSPDKPTGEGVTLVVIKNNTFTTEAKLGLPVVGENPSFIAYSRPSFYWVNIPGVEGSPGFVRELGLSSRFPYITTESVSATEGGGAYISVLTGPSGDKNFERAGRSRGVGQRRILVTADYAGSSVSTYIKTHKTFELADVFNIPLELAAQIRDPSLSNQQKLPHPHMALPYRRGVIVPDLGSDIVFYLGVTNTGNLFELSRLSLMPGDGPRHAALNPNCDTVYIVNEISLSVVVLRTENSEGDDEPAFSVADRVELLSDSANKEGVKAAAIRVSADGKFLYTSVRFPETTFGKIVAFSLNPSTGDIHEKIGEWSSQGVHPRDFYIIEQARFLGKCSSFLAIANRDTANVALVERDIDTGKLMDEAAANMTVLLPTSVLEYN